MINNNPKWIIRLHHYPTGVTVETDSNLFRTQREGYDAGMKLLKSRIWSKTNQIRNKDIIATYNLGEEEQYPYDLSEYRSDNYICDCHRNYGKDCLFPEKYRKEGCS